MGFNLLTICYIIGSVTFILGLKMLSNPASARRGNLIAAAGMLVAIIGTIFLYRNTETGEHLHNYTWIFGGLLIGSVIGTLAARKVKMTAMPEMVSLFNGMGGACAALISLVEFNHISGELAVNNSSEYVNSIQPTVLIIVLGLIIGSVSFAGSMIAWGKLNGKVKDFSFTGQNILNLILLAVALGAGVYLVIHPANSFLLYGILALSLIYGVLFVMPIGGADMPVVISLLNSFTGVAAACGGFLYDNKVMLTGEF
ncbi:MAG: NAD(P)(+) transhydrogenase (Re/Si-specific) subunit beta [Chitinophagaceae bacterium]